MYRPMTSERHHEKALNWADRGVNSDNDHDARMELLAYAQVEATLAVAAAIRENGQD